MPKNAEKTATIEDLRAELAQAKAREDEFAREASGLPNRIKDAAHRAVAQRAKAARAGEDVAGVAAEGEVSALRTRQDEMPYAIWALKLHRAELAANLGELEEQAAHLEVPDAEGKHRAAEAAVVDAQAAEQAAYTAKLRAYGRVDVARKAKNAARAEIEELEAQYPGV